MDGEGMVRCSEHGLRGETFVCQHLVAGQGQGFLTADEADADRPETFERPDAWCAACDEQLRAAGDEWNDENEALAHFTVICEGCYDRSRSRNVR